VNNDQPKPAAALTPTDLVREPVWEFVNDDSQSDETCASGCELPVDSLDGRVAATEVTLRNGRRFLALQGNVGLAIPRLTRHFLTLSLYIDDDWFHLSPYHANQRRLACRSFSLALVCRLTQDRKRKGAYPRSPGEPPTRVPRTGVLLTTKPRYLLSSRNYSWRLT
jgi:hypothetical protein